LDAGRVGRCRKLWRPAYENLQGTKPRFGRLCRAASGGMLSYGDLSCGRTALMGRDTRLELIVERDAPEQWIVRVAVWSEQ